MKVVAARRKSGTFWDRDAVKMQSFHLGHKVDRNGNKNRLGETHASLVMEFFQTKELQKRLRNCTMFLIDAQGL